MVRGYYRSIFGKYELHAAVTQFENRSGATYIRARGAGRFDRERTGRAIEAGSVYERQPRAERPCSLLREGDVEGPGK